MTDPGAPQAGDALHAEAATPAPPVWPVVVAVYSMVAAGHTGLGMTVWLAINPAFFLQFAQAGQGIAPWYFWHFLTQVGLAALSPLLAGAGLAMLTRHWLGRALHLVWAPAAGALAVAGLVAGATQAPEHFWEYAISASVKSLLGLAYPLFLLVWLTHRPVRRQLELRNADRPAYARPIWPTVLGVLAILLSGHALGDLVQKLCWAPGRISRTPLGWMQGYWAVNILASLLAVVLLAGGVALRKRRRVGIQRLRLWAVLMLAALLARSALETIAYRGMQLQPILHAIFMPLLEGAFPVFLLIWFSRPAVKEEAARWPKSPLGNRP